MKRSKFSEQQVAIILRQAEEGKLKLATMPMVTGLLGIPRPEDGSKYPSKTFSNKMRALIEAFGYEYRNRRIGPRQVRVFERLGD